MRSDRSWSKSSGFSPTMMSIFAVNPCFRELRRDRASLWLLWPGTLFSVRSIRLKVLIRCHFHSPWRCVSYLSDRYTVPCFVHSIVPEIRFDQLQRVSWHYTTLSCSLRRPICKTNPIIAVRASENQRSGCESSVAADSPDRKSPPRSSRAPIVVKRRCLLSLGAFQCPWRTQARCGVGGGQMEFPKRGATRGSLAQNSAEIDSCECNAHSPANLRRAIVNARVDPDRFKPLGHNSCLVRFRFQ